MSELTYMHKEIHIVFDGSSAVFRATVNGQRMLKVPTINADEYGVKK